MNAISMEILGGLPTSRFVGRFIKAKIPDLGFSRCKCIEALWGKMVVEVKVKGNRRHYQVPIADCSPNWSDNQDLMLEADKAIADPEALQELKMEIDRRKGSFANPPKSTVVVHKTPPAPVAAVPKPAPQPVVIPPPVQPVLPTKTSIRLDIEEDADITWTEDYKILQASVMEMDEIVAAKATLIARERSNGELIAMCLAEMSRKGVHVLNALTQIEEPVRTIPVPAPEVPLPIQTDPVPVSAPEPEPKPSANPVNTTAPGPLYKRISREQMDKNRHAALQALRTMPPRIPHDIKDVLKLAGLEGNKSLNGPILEMAEEHPKIVVGWQETQRGRKRIFTRTT